MRLSTMLMVMVWEFTVLVLASQWWMSSSHLPRMTIEVLLRYKCIILYYFLKVLHSGLLITATLELCTLLRCDCSGDSDFLGNVLGAGFPHSSI